jgi:hypothetical protein
MGKGPFKYTENQQNTNIIQNKKLILENASLLVTKYWL